MEEGRKKNKNKKTEYYAPPPLIFDKNCVEVKFAMVIVKFD